MHQCPKAEVCQKCYEKLHLILFYERVWNRFADLFFFLGCVALCGINIKSVPKNKYCKTIY